MKFVPYTFGTTTSLASNARTMVSSEYALRTPFREPTLLDEIRFTCQANQWARIRLGAEEFGNDFQPVSMFGRALNGGYGQDGVATAWSYKLPSALLVMPGEFISVEYINKYTGTATLRTTFVGRRIVDGFQRPATRNIPWVAPWKSADITVSTDSQTYESSKADLVNPHDVPLNLSRITGQLIATASGAGVPIFSEPNLNTGAYGFALKDVRLRMTNSDGRIVVRDPTPFGHVFNDGFSWLVNCQLPPKAYILAYLDYVQGNLSSGTYTPWISLSGFREVPF